MRLPLRINYIGINIKYKIHLSLSCNMKLIIYIFATILILTNKKNK